MNNIIASAQRIIRNKNFVTIAGIIIILILLYIGYSSQINKAVSPTAVPVATQTIQPRTEITSDMVKTIDMPSISVTDNVIKYSREVIGMYTNVNSVVPEGSMFYKNTVIDKSELPDSVFVKVKKGEIVYNFPVTMDSTYGNSIFPGNKIDIYMKVNQSEDNNEKILLGKLIENIEVLAVKDSAGRNVFENTEESRTPSMLIFGLPEKLYLMLKKASYLGTYGVELYPVPHGGTIDTTDSTEVSTQELADFIDAHAVSVTTNEEVVTDELAPTISEKGTTTKTVTIKYKKGCGTKYTCTYTKDDGQPVTVTKTKATVKFTTNGKINATLTEEDGTAHNVSQNITIEENTTDNAAAAIGQ